MIRLTAINALDQSISFFISVCLFPSVLKLSQCKSKIAVLQEQQLLPSTKQLKLRISIGYSIAHRHSHRHTYEIIQVEVQWKRKFYSFFISVDLFSTARTLLLLYRCIVAVDADRCWRDHYQLHLTCIIVVDVVAVARPGCVYGVATTSSSFLSFFYFFDVSLALHCRSAAQNWYKNVQQRCWLDHLPSSLQSNRTCAYTKKKTVERKN